MAVPPDESKLTFGLMSTMIGAPAVQESERLLLGLSGVQVFESGEPATVMEAIFSEFGSCRVAGGVEVEQAHKNGISKPEK